jgi:hypothetical protein
MKSFILVLVIILTCLLLACDPVEPIVEDPQDTAIPNLSFTVDTTYLDSSAGRLVASGTVKNNGSTKVTSPWYVEAQFYATKTSPTKLGGNYTQIGVPLSQGQSTFWTIYYSSSNVDVRNYPDFGIRDLRGIYK